MRTKFVFVELGLLLVFGLLTIVVVTTPVLSIDVQIERAIQAFQSDWLDTLTAAIGWVGFQPQSNIIDPAILVIVFFTGGAWAALCAALAAGGSAALWFLLAPLIHRPRPTSDLVRVTADIPFGSFPSGHVLDLTAFFGFLAFLLISLPVPRAVRAVGVALCGLLIVGIGYARLYSGEHWPTDVLAGYVLGAAWLLLCISIYRWGAHRWARRTERSARS